MFRKVLFLHWQKNSVTVGCVYARELCWLRLSSVQIKCLQQGLPIKQELQSMANFQLNETKDLFNRVSGGGFLIPVRRQ